MRPLAAFALLFLLAHPVEAQILDKIERPLFLGTAFADSGVTAWNLSQRGREELNPAFRFTNDWKPNKAAAAVGFGSAGAFLASDWALRQLERHGFRKLPRILRWASIGVHSFAVGYNLR